MKLLRMRRWAMYGGKDKYLYHINDIVHLIPRAQSLKPGSSYPALPYMYMIVYVSVCLSVLEQTFRDRAGEILQASKASLPAAATTTMPEPTSFATASSMALLAPVPSDIETTVGRKRYFATHSMPWNVYRRKIMVKSVNFHTLKWEVMLEYCFIIAAM